MLEALVRFFRDTISGFAYFVYAKKIKNWIDHPVWERIYFSLIWVLLIPLYIVHWIHNKL